MDTRDATRRSIGGAYCAARLGGDDLSAPSSARTGPYSLRLSGRHASDATRVVDRRRATARPCVVDGRARARAGGAAHATGRSSSAAASDAGVDHVRFALGLDDDHSEFLRALRRRPAARRDRCAACAGSGRCAPARSRTHCCARSRSADPGEPGAPDRANGDPRRDPDARRPARAADRGRAGALLAGGSSPASDSAPAAPPASSGSAARSTSSALKEQPPSAVAARLARERGLGPWSVGVVCLEGLGRYEHGLARDLGLVKLASALWGRRAEPEETDVLLEPYGEWAGLASVYLLAGFARGLIPLPHVAAAA